MIGRLKTMVKTASCRDLATSSFAFNCCCGHRVSCSYRQSWRGSHHHSSFILLALIDILRQAKIRCHFACGGSALKTGSGVFVHDRGFTLDLHSYESRNARSASLVIAIHNDT